MRILLERWYTGVKSGMKVIPPGEYEDHELPGGLGLARYLVETDHATDITLVTLDPDPESQSFESWSEEDIQAFAAANDIDVEGQANPDAIATIAQWVEANAVESNEAGLQEQGELSEPVISAFDGWTADQLRDYAVEHEIDFTGLKRKADMITALAAALNDEDEAADDEPETDEEA